MLYESGGWQVRIHPRNCAEHTLRVLEGRLHLQLWHPVRCLSVLLPSTATAHRYEVFPVDDDSARLETYDEVSDLIREVHDVAAPPRERVTDLRMMFVLAAAIGVTRASGADARRRRFVGVGPAMSLASSCDRIRSKAMWTCSPLAYRLVGSGSNIRSTSSLSFTGIVWLVSTGQGTASADRRIISVDARLLPRCGT